MSSRRRAAVVAAAFVLPLLAGGFMLQSAAPRGDGTRLFSQVLALTASRFVDSVDAGALYEKAARGLVRELNDPYSVLYTPKELRDFTANTGGRYAGIGALIEEQENAVLISRVYPNTPAEEGGVREGDRIIQIDTASTRGWHMDRVSETLKGTPGTKVKVTFQRPGLAEPIRVTFTRAVIHIPAVPYAIVLDGGVGYIPLQQFNETSAEETEAAVRRLQKAGARSIVLDLRGNGGGILDQALVVSNLFLPQGAEITSVRERGGPAAVHVARDEPIAPSMPLVVLSDGGTASASEIVAGALQDHDRAVLVGTTSFGKGLVQSLYPLDGGYALKMTTGKYYLPSGRIIHKDRQLVNGRLVEVLPDSLESDSVKKSRPTFRSDGGRVVYGGGGITPDLIVPTDTLRSVEQRLVRALSPKSQQLYLSLYRLAFDLKSQVAAPGFAVRPEWREDLYRRLTTSGVEVDRALFDSASTFVDNLIADRVSRFAFGDSAAMRRRVPQDAQLTRALELLRQGRTQRELFAAAAREGRQG
ncbi:MAG TPA: S41 family peptidase [Gemmatimonadaceae bacterium]|nr:S41 family peptidase [Gemmatimonadaceae bacterium]